MSDDFLQLKVICVDLRLRGENVCVLMASLLVHFCVVSSIRTSIIKITTFVHLWMSKEILLSLNEMIRLLLAV